MKRIFGESFIGFIYQAIIVIALSGLVYVAVQQNYRQSANDPQIQIAEDAASRLAQGEVPAALVTRGAPLVDIKESLATWIAIYDSSGKPIEASGQLNNLPPQPPLKLFDSSTWTDHKTILVNGMKETRVTWQPALSVAASQDGQEPEVRQAIVLVAYTGQGGVGYVVVGRSLRVTEERSIQLGINILIGWAVIIATLLAVNIFGWRILKR